MTVADEFSVRVDDETLQTLRRKLETVVWPDDPGNTDWRYGANSEYLQGLVTYWREQYDWRQTERDINDFANYKVTLDGTPIHFVHERGRGPSPMPIVLTHGWPWTFWDYKKVIRPLADPAAFGGDSRDAFDVVVPSLPGFAFSGPLRQTGVEFTRTADLWLKLMLDVLGYDRFAAYGGDWGSLVSAQLGHKYAEHMIGIQLGISFPLDFASAGLPGADEYADDERALLEHNEAMMATTVSHMTVQSAEPQTLGYALQDSPVGTAAWLIQRRRSWSDCDGDVERCFSKADLIDNVMLYWATGTITSSMRYYWEEAQMPWTPSHERKPIVEAPTGVIQWPGELVLMPQKWMERTYNLVNVTKPGVGGHFHPMEQPDRLVDEIRAFFRERR